MTTTKVTDATKEPITLAQAKSHLRETLVDVDNDAYITEMITTARTAAENRMQRSLFETTWLLTLDCFPAEIRLGKGKIRSIDWIKYVDEAGALQTLAPAAYLTLLSAEPGRVVPAYDTSWPTIRRQPGAVTVQFKAGYAADDEAQAAKVPAPIRHWIKLALTDMYERRGRSEERPAVPQDFADALLDEYKIWAV